MCRLIREYLDLFHHVKSDEFTISFVILDVDYVGILVEMALCWSSPMFQYIQFRCKKIKIQ